MHQLQLGWPGLLARHRQTQLVAGDPHRSRSSCSVPDEPTAVAHKDHKGGCGGTVRNLGCSEQASSPRLASPWLYFCCLQYLTSTASYQSMVHNRRGVQPTLDNQHRAQGRYSDEQERNHALRRLEHIRQEEVERSRRGQQAAQGRAPAARHQFVAYRSSGFPRTPPPPQYNPRAPYQPTMTTQPIQYAGPNNRVGADSAHRNGSLYEEDQAQKIAAETRVRMENVRSEAYKATLSKLAKDWANGVDPPELRSKTAYLFEKYHGLFYPGSPSNQRSLVKPYQQSVEWSGAITAMSNLETIIKDNQSDLEIKEAWGGFKRELRQVSQQ